MYVYKREFTKNYKEFNDKLNNAERLDDVLVNYRNHRIKNQENIEKRREGWDHLKYKYEPHHNPTNPYHLNKAYGDKYNMHNCEEVVDSNFYWDSKENDEFYSKSRFERLKIIMKDTVIFYNDIKYLILVTIVTLVYYANKKSKQILL